MTSKTYCLPKYLFFIETHFSLASVNKTHTLWTEFAPPTWTCLKDWRASDCASWHPKAWSHKLFILVAQINLNKLMNTLIFLWKIACLRTFKLSHNSYLFWFWMHRVKYIYGTPYLYQYILCWIKRKFAWADLIVIVLFIRNNTCWTLKVFRYNKLSYNVVQAQIKTCV